MNAERRTDPEAWEDEEERQGPVVRDKRRIDPLTGQLRETDPRGETPSGPSPAGDAADEPPAEPEQLGEIETQLVERTADLQRLQAEYANYRKRVDRDRVAVREQALANVLTDLLPVLDDIDRARQHGELTGGFQKVAESFEGIVAKLGLTRYGEKGEPFDPTVHEALMHSYSDEVTEPTAVDVLQPGYTVAGRILRPARVAVAEPPESAPEPDAAEAPAPEAGADDEARGDTEQS